MNADMATADATGRWIDAVGVRSLSDVRVLRIDGADAQTWLHGQLTANIDALGPGESAYGLRVDLKGRVEADVWVLRAHDATGALRTLWPADGFESQLESLDRFIVMEDVELAPEPDTRVLTVQGRRAVDALSAAGAAETATWPADRFWLGPGGGFDLLVPAARHDATLAALVEAAESLGGGRVDAPAWEVARLRRGVPRFGRAFGAITYPQEAGLQRRAVAFDKGCYAGQEAVVMLEHRGKPPRRLVRIEMAGGSELEPETPLFDAAGAKVGWVTSAAFDPDVGCTIGLALLKRAAALPEAPVRTELGLEARIVDLCG